MSSRVLILALCVCSVAFACGPRSHNEASAPKNSAAIVSQAGTTRSATAATPKRPAARAATRSSVSAKLSVNLAENSAIRLALHVENTSKKQVEITFPSGQTYDFVILDSLGREVWRWAEGRMFTQTLRNKLLGRGEALDVEETWIASSLQPGRYVVRARLMSQNYPLADETSFTLDARTIASR